MSKFHFLDWGIILTYFIGLIWIGIIHQKDQSTSQNDFILSGRRLSLAGFVATLVTTWYGAILGMEFKPGLSSRCPIIYLPLDMLFGLHPKYGKRDCCPYQIIFDLIMEKHRGSFQPSLLPS